MRHSIIIRIASRNKIGATRIAGKKKNKDMITLKLKKVSECACGFENKFHPGTITEEIKQKWHSGLWTVSYQKRKYRTNNYIVIPSDDSGRAISTCYKIEGEMPSLEVIATQFQRDYDGSFTNREYLENGTLEQ